MYTTIPLLLFRACPGLPAGSGYPALSPLALPGSGPFKQHLLSLTRGDED
ncbi:MAG: hypothetical protein WBA17_08260 [Saprospiraceae bacterium]